MVVMWVTKDQVGTVVRYGSQPGKYTQSTNGNITTYDVGVGGTNFTYRNLICRMARMDSHCDFNWINSWTNLLLSSWS